MPKIKITSHLPYLALISDGFYKINDRDESVFVDRIMHAGVLKTRVSLEFFHSDSIELDEQEKERSRFVKQFVHAVNRLVRWYRTASHQTEVVELTKAQLSPFCFEAFDTKDVNGWSKSIEYEVTGPRLGRKPAEELNQIVRNGLATGKEPDVADLFLIDAEQALHEGRFREAVLFCWSTIDSVFNQKYEKLVGIALANELSSARDFFTGVDFGLKNKMSAVMHLIAKRSLYRESNNFWEKLTTSYNKRNGIIHRGDTASEDDAILSLEVANKVVDIMSSILVLSGSTNSGNISPVEL